MAGLMGIEGPVRFLVYVRNGFLLGKVAKVGGLLRVEGPIPCLVYVCTWRLRRYSSISSIYYEAGGE